MHILFVCTGNTCRSPLAEAIAREVLKERGITAITVASAGTSAYDGAAASDGSLLVALEHGVDLGDHRARQLTSDLVRAADLILVMGPHHVDRVEALGGEGKAHLLAQYASRGTPRAINDPFGGDLTMYRSTYEELDREIRLAIDRATAERTSDA